MKTQQYIEALIIGLILSIPFIVETLKDIYHD